MEEASGEFQLEAENYNIPLSELLRRILDEHIDGKRSKMAGFYDKNFSDIALDSLEDAFYVLSVAENGRLVRWNDAFAEVTGYSDEELSKMTFFDFFDEEGKEQQGDFLLRLLKDGHGTLEIDIADKNSNKIPYEFHSTLVKDPVSDEPVAVVGTGRNISKHKEWEARLKESEDKYRQIFEHALEGIFQTSLDGKIISANPSLARMYGYDSPEQMKEEISDVATQLYADPEDREDFKKLILDANKVEAFETLFKRRDGETVWVSIDAHTVKGESNNILYLEGTTENITAKKEYEDKLKKANKELEGYSHTVSHDLKGPLTAIFLAHEVVARLIESKAPELLDETSEVMQISSRSLERATGLIDSLLSMAETGKPEDTCPVDLNEKIKNILFEKKTELDAKGIEVKTDDLGKLVANPTHVYQIFSNLLRNAMSYVDSDNGLIEVKKLDENRYLVRDNGPGISEKVIDDIFDPFVKGVGGDTGLGLSIVKKIVETYGGEIKAYNDNGACFEFTLKDYSEEQ